MPVNKNGERSICGADLSGMYASLKKHLKKKKRHSNAYKEFEKEEANRTEKFQSERE